MAADPSHIPVISIKGDGIKGGLSQSRRPDLCLFSSVITGVDKRALLRDDLQPQQSPVLGKVQRCEFLRVTLLHLGPEFRASALVHASLIGASVCLLTRAPSTWLVHFI